MVKKLRTLFLFMGIALIIAIYLGCAFIIGGMKTDSVGEFVDCDYHGSGIVTYEKDGVIVWSGIVIDRETNEGLVFYKKGKGTIFKEQCPTFQTDEYLARDFLCSVQGKCDDL